MLSSRSFRSSSNLGSIVLRFAQSESGELVKNTHDSLVRLLESSTDNELAERPFGPVPLTSYSPRPENLMADPLANSGSAVQRAFLPRLRPAGRELASDIRKRSR
jgi:hypothetical protein